MNKVKQKEKITDSAAVEDNYFSLNMRRIRKRKSLSIKDVAVRTGLDSKNVAYCETRCKNPNLITIRKIAKALDVGLAEILGEDTAVFRNIKRKATMFNCIMRDNEIMSMSDSEFRKRVEEYIRLYKKEREWSRETENTDTMT